MDKRLKISLQVLSGFGLAAMGCEAFAANIGQVANGLTTQLGSISDTVGSAMYLGAIGTGGMAAFKLKEHAADPRNTKLSVPMTYLAAAGVLSGLPTILATSSDSLAAGGQATRAGITSNNSVYGNANP